MVGGYRHDDERTTTRPTGSAALLLARPRRVREQLVGGLTDATTQHAFAGRRRRPTLPSASATTCRRGAPAPITMRPELVTDERADGAVLRPVSRLSTASSGVAMKIDEYDAGDHADEQGERELLERDGAHDARRRGSAATSRGGSTTRLVISDRISTWFIEMLTTSSYGMRTAVNLPSFSSTRSNTTMVS